MRIYAENKETKEVYECNKAKIIADIRSHYNCSEEIAKERLANTFIETPLDVDDCIVWNE